MPDVKTMNAIVAAAPGGPEVLQLQDVPRPEAGSTEVLVRVHAAGVNPVDWKSRAAGNLVEPPWTPGWDVAGVVEAVGFGVTILQPGDRVFGMPAFPREAGAYAEFATARARQLVKTPDTISDTEAAAIPLGGLTAYQALVDTARIGRDSRVLILAAGGGVGHLAVQIAKDRGAHVIGTAREVHRDRLEAFGLDELVDYTSQDVGGVVGDIDVIVDLVGGQAGLDALPALRDGGLFINVPSGADADRVRNAAGGRVDVTSILVEPDHVGMLALADMIERGALNPVVSRTFPLADAAAAHAVGEAGETGGGKLVLTVDHRNA